MTRLPKTPTISRCILAATLTLTVVGHPNIVGAALVAARPASPSMPSIPAAGPTLFNAILFVTQVPTKMDINMTTSTFNNHMGGVQNVARGGDLWVRFADGTLRNLTQAAGYGDPDGFQGSNSIAVRDPAVHWDGHKALFSMVVGSPATASEIITPVWQIYEVSGFDFVTSTVVMTKVANQPSGFNNITPIYGTDDRVIFTSDRPWPRSGSGASHLYPMLDEYNLRPTNTGLWSLDPNSGNLKLLDASPSGDFAPSIDSYGRLIFVRWDHLERDQQHDIDYKLTGQQYGGNCIFCTFNYSDEAITATKLLTNVEAFPEPRPNTLWLSNTNFSGHHMNEFIPWAINEDGSGGETINHVGRHELLKDIPPAFTDDPALQPLNPAAMFNQTRTKWFIQMREDSAHPGVYFGVNLLELTHASGQIISMTGSYSPFLSADKMGLAYITHQETMSTSGSLPNSTGHYRDPLPMSNGTLIAAHTTITGFEAPVPPPSTWLQSKFDFRLRTLKVSGGYYVPDQALTAGIAKSITYWYSPTLALSYSGNLWELQPVEVQARPRPSTLQAAGVALPEQSVFTQTGVDVSTLQAWMAQNNLGLAIMRNVTRRDAADLQQPFNLKVGTLGGTQTVTGTGKVYSITTMQFMQADQIRGVGGITNTVAGRRVLAQPMHDVAASAANLPVGANPMGSAVIGDDGSVAAFVPARRPVSWQLMDANGQPVVRERFWLTYQPGEIRVCAACHGLNSADQAGNTLPQNSPQALVALLNNWKQMQTVATATPTTTATATPTMTATPTATATPTQIVTGTLPTSATATATPIVADTPTPTLTPTATSMTTEVPIVPTVTNTPSPLTQFTFLPLTTR